MSDLRTLLHESEPQQMQTIDFQLLFARARRRTTRRRIAAVGSAGGLLVAVLLAVAFLRDGASLKIDVIQPADPTTEEVPGSVFEVGSSESRPQGGAGPASSAGGGPARSARTGGTGTPRQAATVEGEKARIPVRAGTYSYEVSGSVCMSFGPSTACDDAEQLEGTYDQPIGSHQRLSGRLKYRRNGKSDYEMSHDYRPDGVYWEHYSETFVNPWGVPGTWACPELAAAPVRVWKTGAKPGDHFENSVPCDGLNPNDPEASVHNTLDIVKAEMISIGGREVLTLFVRQQSYRDGKPSGTMEGWVLTDQLLFVKSDKKWWGDGFRGELSTELKSLTPS